MERETELTQSWNPELTALNDDSPGGGGGGGLLKGLPLQISGEMRTFSLPVMPQDDDGTDISLKDWHVGPRDTSSSSSTTSPPFSIKPFKGSVRTRFTPVEPRLDEDLTSPRGGGQSSPEHFETPTTTPRMSSSGTRSSSVSPTQSRDPVVEDPNEETFHQTNTTAGIAFDISAKEESTQDNEATSALRARSLRVSFKDNSNPPQRHSAPVVRHRSPLKSRSILPSKEVKALQPKWESSTKIRPEKTNGASSYGSKPLVQAPLHGMKARKGKGGSSTRPAAKRARAVVPVPTATPEIEPVELHSSGSGYLSERYSGRYSGRDFRRSVDSSMGHQQAENGAENGAEEEYGSLSRELTMSPIHRSGRKEFESGRSAAGSPGMHRSHGGRHHADDSEGEEDEMKGGMMCGGGLSDTKLSGDFVRLLSKLCRVSVPKQQPPMSKSVSLPTSRGRNGSNALSLSWDPSTQNVNAARDSTTNKITIIGRHDSLKLLSEKCSNAPAPAYTLHKPRKIRNHEPHQHFYRTISKTLDQKLRS